MAKVYISMQADDSELRKSIERMNKKLDALAAKAKRVAKAVAKAGKP